ncbi:MAG: putative HTH-type transcriptional regulator YtcD [Candidatus Heimdallarchaeota archaeon LC_3]|nr:MAG: putative HTH-type transcriptional regulator YtcD [Candidatus Heimdallarchaeota archaeon LC_3]
MIEFIESPIHITLSIISKKWAVEIINELFTGRKRYSDLLELNQSISSKVLSERLKELYNEEIIDKIITNMIPLKIKYQLTEKGRFLNRILFELAIFGSLFYRGKILEKNIKHENDIINYFGSSYKIDPEEQHRARKRYNL